MKKIYIRQYAGLGDIFFLQKAAHVFLNSGYDEIMPVIQHYEYLKDYIVNDKIKFISKDSIPVKIQEAYKYDKCHYIDDLNSVYIPFDKACQNTGKCSNFLEEKYSLINLDFSDWQKYCKFKRYPERENKCREYFGINEGDKFIFVNNIFASPPKTYTREMDYFTDLKIVEHKPEHLNMFNFFDFSWLLENAEEIHTVETSLCYLVEFLDTKASLNLYSRKINGNNQYPNFDYIENIYKKEWNKIL